MTENLELAKTIIKVKTIYDGRRTVGHNHHMQSRLLCSHWRL